MKTVNKVLVIGAGASVPYGFSSGKGLRDKIKKSCLENVGYLTTHYQFEKSLLEKFGNEIRLAAPKSIDFFLERKSAKDYQYVGKMLIAHHLIKEEQDSEELLYNAPPTLKHWYEYFWHEINTVEPDDFKNNNITIINFNYDRSLEYYLFNAIKHNYNLKNDDEVFDLMKAVKIIHPYGSLGSLDKKSPMYVPYGKNYSSKSDNFDLVSEASKQINIIYEGKDDSDDFKSCHAAIANARLIYIMGFGFHEKNVERLLMGPSTGPTIWTGNKATVALVKGFTEHLITSKIRPLLHKVIHFDTTSPDCLDFLQNNY